MFLDALNPSIRGELYRMVNKNKGNRRKLYRFLGISPKFNLAPVIIYINLNDCGSPNHVVYSQVNEAAKMLVNLKTPSEVRPAGGIFEEYSDALLAMPEGRVYAWSVFKTQGDFVRAAEENTAAVAYYLCHVAEILSNMIGVGYGLRSELVYGGSEEPEQGWIETLMSVECGDAGYYAKMYKDDYSSLLSFNSR